MSEVTAEMIERGRGLDPKAATARRKRGAKVQRARERLTTSDTGHRGSDLALLRRLRRGAREFGDFRLLADRDGVSARLLLDQVQCRVDWAVLTFSSLILCYGVAKNLGRLEDARVTVKLWSTRFILAEFIHGLAWASLVTLLGPVADANAKIFMIVILLMAAAFTP